uniref:TNFR-Cys domain-containing protein n=1 Tax=Ciona savignyi TaxID=51511 RepID=H2YU73_CIOSA
MMGRNLRLLCVNVIIIVIAASAESKHRRRKRPICIDIDEYYNTTLKRCVSCTVCPPGSGVINYCKWVSDYSDTVCEACVPEMTYSTERSSPSSPCYPCTSCGGRKVKHKCTIYSDTVCGDCPQGEYWDRVDYKCKPCSHCSATAWPFFESDCIRANMPASRRCRQPYVSTVQKPKLRSVVGRNGSGTLYTSETENVIAEYSVVQLSDSEHLTSGNDVTSSDVTSDDEDVLMQWLKSVTPGNPTVKPINKENTIDMKFLAVTVPALFILILVLTCLLYRNTVTSHNADYKKFPAQKVTCFVKQSI